MKRISSQVGVYSHERSICLCASCRCQITLNDADRAILERWSRGRSTPARLVMFDPSSCSPPLKEEENKDIATELKISRGAVARWRDRFAKSGVKGARRRCTARRTAAKGTPRSRDATNHRDDDPAEARQRDPLELRARLAEAVGTNRSLVNRVWRAGHGLKPHLCRTFKVSNDPHFAEKLLDVVGLYLHPPEHALVLTAKQHERRARSRRWIAPRKRLCRSIPADPKRRPTTTSETAPPPCLPRHGHVGGDA